MQGRRTLSKQWKEKRESFKVKSQTSSKIKYEVDLTNPCCTCKSWITSRFLCKHFFIVFNSFQEWGFHSLPNKYLNNAMITLYECVVPKSTSNLDQQLVVSLPDQSKYDFIAGELPMKMEPTANEDSMKSNIDDTTTSGTSVKLPSIDSLKRKVLEQLEGLKNTVFLVQDNSILQDAITNLQQVHASLKHSCPTHNGIPLRSSYT